MRVFHLTRNKYHMPTVNLDRLWSLVSEQTRTAYKDRTDKAPVIDVLQAVSSRQCNMTNDFSRCVSISTTSLPLSLPPHRVIIRF